jgi:hypothetical protein
MSRVQALREDLGSLSADFYVQVYFAVWIPTEAVTAQSIAKQLVKLTPSAQTLHSYLFY